MKKSNKQPLITSGIGLLLCSLFAQSAIISVDGNDGSVTMDGSCSISEAIINANNDAQTHSDCVAGSGIDTIILNTDVNLTTEFENDIFWGRTATPPISTAVVLNGQGHVLERDSAFSCTINFTSNLDEFRLLRVSSTGNLSLNNMIVRGGCVDSNGQTSADGGGIVNEGTLSIMNSVIDNNQSGGYGGGLTTENGTVEIIENSLFSNNTAQLRGGGLNQYNGIITAITNTTFSNNLATDGGGLYVEDMTVLLIDHVTFSANTANFGSAMVNQFATVSNLQNSLFHSGSSCGYINGFGSAFTGNNNLSDETSGTNCPGVLATTLNSVTVGPLADNGCTTPLSDGSCAMTHALLVNAEALNLAGSGTTTDQRGFNADGLRDVGAYEAQIPVITAPADVITEATGSVTNTPALGFASASDVDSDDLTLSVTNDAAVNYTLGVHTVTWTVTDNHGHQSTDTQSVTIQDTTAPVLSLLGTSPVSLNVGDSYSDAGATATDLVDDDAMLTANIVVNNSVNTNVAGSYTVSYNVTDNAGNVAAEISRVVNVNVGASPQIQLSTSSINFGGILIGQDDTEAVTVTNNGNANLNLTSFSALSVPFAVSHGSCSPLPMTLAPTSSCTFEVTYSPTATSNDTAQLSIISNAPSSPTGVDLQGFGNAPATPVPTLSEWALLLLFGSVLISRGLFYHHKLIGDSK